MIGYVEDFPAKVNALRLPEQKPLLYVEVEVFDAWPDQHIAARVAGDTVRTLRIVKERRADEAARVDPLLWSALTRRKVSVADAIRPRRTG